MNHKTLNFEELRTSTKLLNNFDNQAGKNQEEKEKTVPLSTQNAVKYLLQGTLRLRVCRYCLHVTEKLSELNEILTIALSGSLHEVTVKDIVASFHPFKVSEDPNFPNKICSKCVRRAIGCYLFTQQCEQAERALKNCFDEIYEKLEKLDPLEPIKKRGKRKLNPNHNLIYAEHNNVIDYAEPIINIVNITESTSQMNEEINKLECQKCWQVLPNIESLINHEKSHPKTMWFNCRLCGKSFVKRTDLKRHNKRSHMFAKEPTAETTTLDNFKCNVCDAKTKTLAEYLQHNEKHKFKGLFKSLIERKVDGVCSVCFDKGSRLTDLREAVHLHGGYSGLTGEKTLESILKDTIPGITLDNYTGTKICDKCFNQAISSYIFIFKIQHVRNRLNTCVSVMLDTLKPLTDTKQNLIVEISSNTILPLFELNEINEDVFNEEALKVEVLEDEFREESDSISGSYISDDIKDDITDYNSDDLKDEDNVEETMYNPAKHVTKTYTNKKLANGYQKEMEGNMFNDVCSEFLTFKKKLRRPTHIPKYRYTCPFCNKHFISDYFIKKHIVRHMQSNVKCSICLHNFKSKFYLFEHKKMDHVLKLRNFLTCKVCGRTFANLAKLKCHEKSHRIKECQLCDKVYVSQRYFDVHMQRHAVKFKAYNNRYVQTCSFCEKACSNENELSLHVNKMHLQIKPYSCDMCDRQFYTETNLCSHKKLHSLLSKEICAFCGKVFKCRKNLVVHVRKHIGMKPHICPVCRQPFYSDTNMKKHMKMLHGGIYCCRLCRTVVPSPLDLKSHINLMHSTM